jgi:hypothetical protein
LEAQIDNFDMVEEAIRFMASRGFEENPVGVDFDGEEFVRIVRGRRMRRVLRGGRILGGG